MKKQITIDVKNSKDTFEHLNCFEKPLGMIMEQVYGYAESSFYLFLKLLQCYKIEGFEDESLFYTIDYNKALKYIIEDILGFQPRITKANADILHSVIKDYIDHGMYALVPGNLKQHYNTEYYKKNDWQHLFLVNGYDDEKEVYYVVDSNHENGNNGECYMDLVFSFDFMKELYESAGEAFQIESIWGFYDIKGEKKTQKQLLSLFLELYLNHSNQQPFYEIDYIDRINQIVRENQEEIYDENDYKSTKSIDFIFVRSMKYKELMYQELIKLLQRLDYNQDIIMQIATTKDKILLQWNNIANKALVYKFLKKESDLYDDILDGIELENRMKKHLCSLKIE